MQTKFSPQQLHAPAIAEADRILRKCVHCGFCLATCPIYVLRGNELDSPRGRIYLVKDMLEAGRDADATVTLHIDRCLSCLGCMTTCPSGVDYMHLVDHVRVHIENTYRRPWPDRALRAMLARVLPYPRRLRPLLILAALAGRIGLALPGRLMALLRLAPRTLPRAAYAAAQIWPAEGETRMRAGLLAGCVQQPIAPEINEATIRLLRRLGCEVVVVPEAGCCGALSHHLGRDREAAALAARNVAAWTGENESRGLDAVIANASGCGTMLKDYGHVLAQDPAHAEAAHAIATLAADVSEVIARLDLAAHVRPGTGAGLRVAYHAACALAHGQNITDLPARLLVEAGFEVCAVPEGHLCCGSAGTYNVLQPDFATDLGARKAAHIESTGADVVAAGNIGCLVQLRGHTGIPAVHTVELLDWATGGPKPASLSQ
jgi:glycolate oxidase iron-sulfur subunit